MRACYVLYIRTCGQVTEKHRQHIIHVCTREHMCTHILTIRSVQSSDELHHLMMVQG